MGKTGYLILENGIIVSGISFGFEKNVSGEVVFNTGMTGYPESFTDPSYYGQILTMTYPLIGNYGVPPLTQQNGLSLFLESEKIQIRGLIVSSYIEENTHWQSKESLSSWLKMNKIPALSGIDTRSLTKILRECGVMKGIITFKPLDKPRNISGFIFSDIYKDNLVPYVSCKKITKYGKGNLKILFIDCGLKNNQIRMLLTYDTTIIRVPWDYDPFNAENPVKFDTIFISNGPGDAHNMPKTIAVLKQALKRKIPTFGICLGHQLLTLATGGDIYKLKYGHRGQNQPVRDLFSGSCYITSQNHGFAVAEDKVPTDWKIWFKNLNDGTNEGIHHKRLPFFSVQFHPEAAPGPTDTKWLFDYYISRVMKWLKRN